MIRKALLVGLSALALLAAPASADILTRVQRAYAAHGLIPTCAFSSRQLESALKGIDTYGEQYFADFSAAVQSALAARASGACSPRTTRAPLAPPPAAPSPPLRLGPITAATGADLPAPMLLMAVICAVLSLTGLLAALAWWRGWSPAWWRAWRHMWSEAGFRMQGTWLEFSDWLRSGSR